MWLLFSWNIWNNGEPSGHVVTMALIIKCKLVASYIEYYSGLSLDLLLNILPHLDLYYWDTLRSQPSYWYWEKHIALHLWLLFYSIGFKRILFKIM